MIKLLLLFSAHLVACETGTLKQVGDNKPVYLFNLTSSRDSDKLAKELRNSDMPWLSNHAKEIFEGLHHVGNQNPPPSDAEIDIAVRQVLSRVLPEDSSQINRSSDIVKAWVKSQIKQKRW